MSPPSPCVYITSSPYLYQQQFCRMEEALYVETCSPDRDDALLEFAAKDFKSGARSPFVQDLENFDRWEVANMFPGNACHKHAVFLPSEDRVLTTVETKSSTKLSMVKLDGDATTLEAAIAGETPDHIACDNDDVAYITSGICVRSLDLQRFECVDKLVDPSRNNMHTVSAHTPSSLVLAAGGSVALLFDARSREVVWSKQTDDLGISAPGSARALLLPDSHRIVVTGCDSPPTGGRVVVVSDFRMTKNGPYSHTGADRNDIVLMFRAGMGWGENIISASPDERLIGFKASAGPQLWNIGGGETETNSPASSSSNNNSSPTSTSGNLFTRALRRLRGGATAATPAVVEHSWSCTEESFSARGLAWNGVLGFSKDGKYVAVSTYTADSPQGASSDASVAKPAQHSVCILRVDTGAEMHAVANDCSYAAQFSTDGTRLLTSNFVFRGE